MNDIDKSKAQLLKEIHLLREELATIRSQKCQEKALFPDSFNKTLIDQSPISMQILSPDGKTLHVNPAWEKLWGISLEKLGDHNVLEDPQVIKNGLLPHIYEGFAGKVTELPAALYYIAKSEKNPDDTDGRWIATVIYPIIDALGNNIKEVVLVHFDQTAPKRAEDSLRLAYHDMQGQVEKRTNEFFKSKERFSLAMRGSDDGMWDWNLVTDEVYYSHRWKSMLGYEENELEAGLDTWATLVHPDDKNRVLDMVQDYIAGRTESFEVEMRMCHKDGHEVFILSRAYLVNNDSDNNEPIRLVGTHVDITERKKSEQFVLKTSNILKMIATREPAGDIYDAIALLYEARHPGLRCSMLVLEDNKLMHGGAPSLPKEYCDAVNGLEYGPSVGSCGTATYTGKRVLVESIETDPKWKNIKHVALPHGMRCCWSEPIKNSSGMVLGAFGMYYNHPALPNEKELTDLESAARLAGIIMERQKSEEELNLHRHKLEQLVSQRTLQLEEANRTKDIFLANMSHEIRTPMNAIVGFLGLVLENPSLPDIERKHLFTAKTSADSLLGLIDDILDVSKLERGNLSIEHHPFDLCGLMQEVYETMSIKAQEKGIRLHLDIHPALSGYYLCDALRLKQILTNLTGNAVKFTKEGRIIMRVMPDEKEEWLHFTVEDTGLGIPPGRIKHIFEPFIQADTSTTRKFGGTGLGLTIARELVELMGGKIWFESEEGKGSTFHFTVNIAPTDQVLESSNLSITPDKAILSNARYGQRILLVEDIEFNVDLVNIRLKQQGHEVMVAWNGREAVEAFSALEFDLILMDIHMPEMGGVEATKRIRALEADSGGGHMPIIAMTAAVLKNETKKYMEVGMDAVVAKPIDFEILFNTMEAVVPKSKRETVSGMTDNKWKVLVVDNDPNNLKLLNKILRDKYQLSFSIDGQNTLDVAGRVMPDIILLDTTMPGMDGYEVYRRLKDNPETVNIPVIFTSASIDDVEKQKGLNLGAVDFITKPIDSSEIRKKVKQHLLNLNEEQ